MRYIIRIFLTGLLFLFASTTLSAQEIVMETDTLTLYFKVNKHNYDPSYMGNKARMEKFLDHLNNLKQGDYLELDFDVTSSPEGRYELNSELSKRRAESIEKYLRKHTSLPESVVEVFHLAEAWDGLEEQVRNCDMPWRDDVLEILENYPQTETDENGKLIEPRKKALMEYKGGEPWRYMLRNWFPTLRRFTVVMKSGIHAPLLGDVEIEEDEFIPFEEIKIEDKKLEVALMPMWHPELTLKTNGLGWGLGHFNAAVEYDLAPHWSLALPFYYSGGIDYFKSTLKFRGIVIQPEARYYFKGNDGWYIGAHLGLGWYNFALGGEYRIQDHKGNRPAWGGGVGAGYTMQFKTNPRWGLEFTLGAGAYDVMYDIFYNEANGPYAERGVHNTFIGIDNASVAVTYKFGKIRKEGRK